MTGYTKGEWRVIETNLSLHESDYVADLSNGLMVVSDGKLGDARADADLIAASPDLLEALQALIDDAHPARYDYRRHAARIAIAKATGQS